MKNRGDLICPKNLKIRFGAFLGHKFKTYISSPLELNLFLNVFILIFRNFLPIYSYEVYPLQKDAVK
ncbi:hypothetical protein SP4011_10560 [Streptococcus parapneumoniae]|uniref:Uncharacterized protein n=2 Tax=Streptococcus TaxID=1301 RepID=A0ABN6TMW5_9STRE|nr:hypothetical protein STYK_10610 [Streptococcus toyakuensis]BDT64639.1 hypothetical protein SP4011_10560 [Streptococcus sp. SP4011]